MRLILAVLAASVALLGTTSLADAADPPAALPSYTPAYEPTTVDERGLWMQADERERNLRDSPLRIRDGGLETYLREVLCREVGQQRCSGVRVYAMEIPAFNATMMPNGAMEVWSGLLLRVRNEGELAAVLGHEFAHFELRHSVAGFKNRRGTTNAMAWLAVLGGAYSAGIQPLLVGSIFRFSREHETEADLLGLKYLAASGYPAKNASEVWQMLLAEQDATAAGRKIKPQQKYTSGFFDTHPASLSRVAYLAEAAAKLPDGGDARAKAYQDAIAPYLPRFLAAQTKLNDFGGTEYILANLAARSGWTANLLFARAELHRTRANPRDLQSASDLYRQARSAGYVGSELDRNLGLSLLRNGQTTEARTALSAYLAPSPDAPDAKAIHALLED